MPRIQNTGNIKGQWWMWSNRTQVHCCWGCKRASALGGGSASRNETYSDQGPAFTLRGIRLKELETDIHRETDAHTESVDAYGSFSLQLPELGSNFRHPSAGKEKQKAATFKQWDAIPRLKEMRSPAMMRRGGGFNARLTESS